ncbi:hypothetical protein ACJJTC_007521 [Scirpophaga incertulas]
MAKVCRLSQRRNNAAKLRRPQTTHVVQAPSRNFNSSDNCQEEQFRVPLQAVCTGESLHETNPVTTTHVPTPSRSNSITSRTSRSSAIITVRKLAAETQHARHVARLKLGLATRKLELERNTAELEYQAEIAATEAQAQVITVLKVVGVEVV